MLLMFFDIFFHAAMIFASAGAVTLIRRYRFAADASQRCRC